MEKMLPSEKLNEIPTIDIEFIEYQGVDQTLTDAWFARVQLRLATEEAFMDKGLGGKVYGINQKVCAKAIEINPTDPLELQQRKFSNTSYQEAIMHFEISRLREKGLQCPAFLAYLQGVNHDVILMQKLSAIKLEDIILGKQKMPEHISKQNLLDQLQEQTSLLHAHGFAHRDLESRNWMVDMRTQKLYMIDFGWAVKLDSEQIAAAVAKDNESLRKIIQDLTNL